MFAIPGCIGDTYSEGCNKLIKTNKAALFQSVKDLEYIMNWSAGSADGTIKHIVDLSAEEQVVIDAIATKGLSMQIDELAWKTNIPLGALSTLLLHLEFKGAIKPLPGKLYQLTL